MMVANSFDLWQKDSFFSAAEEVQESADIMESAYRTWVRERREMRSPENLDELSRELQTTLGTAKWQLEEFERAVRLSYGHGRDDNSTTRHRQFIVAIENQISRVEAALRESFLEEGKQPLRWVNLDEEERDDLAAFLSGTSQVIGYTSSKDECIELRPTVKSSYEKNHIKRTDADPKLNSSCNGDNFDEIKCFKDVISSTKDVNNAMELERNDFSGSRDDIICQADRATNTRRTWSSPNVGDLRIVIADEDEQRHQLLPDFEDTPKEKGSKLLFWKQRCGEVPQVKGAVHVFNRLFGRVGGFQRQLQNPPRLQYGCSVPVTLALMLTIFLIVPFLFYSN
ncbi:uncharacterized protein LOC107410274 isoform X1 [Ziziphus jujuba]|uniref:Uncharacterized protein LOC107410274 isoform X1 n=2 Tax=Ziziphus jujuba TaxID=326968 RepID=A0ABM3IUT4_ZIZJJ|nr:uncharacterized protein LOC107410274 isoform X1 [Ziziphus jujuba]